MKMENKIPINLKEYENYQSDSLCFTKVEIEILKKLKDKIEVVGEITESNTIRYILKATQYTGYVILPDHVIEISPKFSRINFINMIRYALNLTEYSLDSYVDLHREENYYDILVLMFLQELEQIIQKGFLRGYQTLEENSNFLKGKILFKENIFLNYNRPDKIYCSFDELSIDTLENRIIKFTLQGLSQCYFQDEKINTKILQLSNYLGDVSLQSFTKDAINLIEYSPVNQHYKKILSLCDLFFQNSSIEQRIGERNVNSFLIDMNLLFEKFIVSIIRKSPFGLEIHEQKREFADLSNQLEFKLDIVVSIKGKPLLILDTKYKEYGNKPEASDVEQILTYSTIAGVKNCGLIYPGKRNIPPFLIKHNINLHIILINLEAQNSTEFDQKVNTFTNSLYHSVIQPLIYS
jgi:5-methylcytosine-specific restriction enzyme subunit McrC